MTWFFAMLAVLALGVIAMVASGYGRPMSQAYDDRRDVVLPRHDPIGAGDLRRVRFTSALRGYRASEVDTLLSRLAEQLEAAEERAGAGEQTGSGGGPESWSGNAADDGDTPGRGGPQPQ